MSRLFLVRHGPTHAKSMVGWSDLPADLSDTEALARLGAYFPKDAVVVSSDLQRAVHTADAIQGDRQRLAHDPDLREMHFGDWELKAAKEVEDQERLYAFWDSPGDVTPPKGESWNQVVARTSAAVDRLIETHPKQDIVIVCHFGVILAQLQRATGQSAYDTFAQSVDNLSVTELTVGSSWTSGKVNHLP